jgi:hypothetical protein
MTPANIAVDKNIDFAIFFIFYFPYVGLCNMILFSCFSLCLTHLDKNIIPQTYITILLSCFVMGQQHRRIDTDIMEWKQDMMMLQLF